MEDNNLNNINNTNEVEKNIDINNQGNNNLRKVLISIVIILILGLIVLTLYVVLNKKDDNIHNNKDNIQEENKDNNLNNNEKDYDKLEQKVLDEYYLKSTDIIDEHILEYRYSAIVNNEISYSDFRRNYVVKNIIGSLEPISSVGGSASHLKDEYDKNGLKYPKYCNGDIESRCIENIAKDFGLTVDEISKIDKSVWNTTGGQYSFKMYDGKEVKDKYLDIYNDVFNSSFSIYLSNEIYGVGYSYSYDKNIDKIITAGHGGVAEFYTQAIIEAKKDGNLYKIKYVEGHFTPSEDGKWEESNIKEEISKNDKKEAEEFIKRNKDKLPNYEITFEKTSTGYKYKSIKKVENNKQGIIETSKEESLKSTIIMVATQVENQYAISKALNKDFAITGSCMQDWSRLNNSDYKSCTYSVDDNGNATVIIEGKGKFSSYKHCEGTKNSIISCNKSVN